MKLQVEIKLVLIAYRSYKYCSVLKEIAGNHTKKITNKILINYIYQLLMFSWCNRICTGDLGKLYITNRC